MIDNHDLTGMLKHIIERETVYMKHYDGKVVNNADPYQKGRVQVTIERLGWTPDTITPWVYPRQFNAMSIPLIDSYVEVYFMEGDASRPVYIYPSTELSGQVPSGFSGIPSDNLIYQDMTNNNTINMNTVQQICNAFNLLKIEILTRKIKMVDATDAFILSSVLDQWFQTLVTWLKTHVHTSAAPGSPTTVATDQSIAKPQNYQSQNIFGS